MILYLGMLNEEDIGDHIIISKPKIIILIFLFGLVMLIIGFLLRRPYLKNPPVYGVKRENKWDYLKDGYRLISLQRAMSFITFGLAVILLSIILFVCYLFG